MRKELISIGRDSGNDLNQVEEGAMPTIDADAHVIECEQTWSYIKDEKLRHDQSGRRPAAKLAGRQPVFQPRS
jgi:hypothetical protein